MRKIIICTLALVLCATAAQAASLKICYDPSSANPDAIAVNVLNPAVNPPVVFATALTSLTGCFNTPFPAGLVRGVQTPIAIQFANSLGEVGPVSNTVSFRAPLIPGQPATVTVQIVTP